MKKFLLAILLAVPAPAWATPQSTAYVVNTCGTIPQPPGPWLARTDPNNAAALTVDPNGLLCTNSTFSGTVTGTFTPAKATAAPPTYGEGTDQPLSVTLAGSLRAVLTATASVIGAVTQSGTWNIGTVTTLTSITNPVAVTIASLPALPNFQSVNLAQVNGGTVATGSGAMNAQTLRTALATDSPGIITTGTPGSASTQVLTIQGVASMTPVAVSLSAGSAVIGHVITDTGSVSQITAASGGVANGAFASGALAVGAISNGADVAEGLTTDAKNSATDTTAVSSISLLKEISSLEQAPVSRAVTNAGTFAVQSQPTATASGGATGYVLEPAASDNHAVIKNGAGTVYDIVMFNDSATINYWRLYDAGTGFNGCNSATNLVAEGHIPASTSDAGFTVSWGAVGHAFITGISICVTGGYGQTNTTAAIASHISLTIGYK